MMLAGEPLDFDDLIPADAPVPPEGMANDFDDLVPAEPADEGMAQEEGIQLDDLFAYVQALDE